VVRSRFGWTLVGVLVAALACSQETGRLSPEQEQRFAGEGILHRADVRSIEHASASARCSQRFAKRCEQLRPVERLGEQAWFAFAQGWQSLYGFRVGRDVDHG